MSYTAKQLQVYVTVRSGAFADGSNTKIIKGVPIKARVVKTGPPDLGKATVEVYGISYADMEQLTTVSFRPLYYARNVITLYAGDDATGLTPVFTGDITRATADFNSAPDIKFTFECVTGYFGLLTVQRPTAITGSQAISDFIKQQATTLGYSFTNNGVSAQLKNAVFTGSPLQQARQAAKQIGAELLLDDDTLILNPSGTAIGTAVTLNKDSGLIGYPVISNNGIEIKALYNPSYRLGGIIDLESAVPKASGQWRIIKLSHDLASGMQGNWFSQMTCFYPSLSGAGGVI